MAWGFADPFGLAWVGFLIIAVLIIGGGWVLLMFAPTIMRLLTFLIKILTLPFRIFSGSGKKGIKETTSSGKSALYKIGKK